LDHEKTEDLLGNDDVQPHGGGQSQILRGNKAVVQGDSAWKMPYTSAYVLEELRRAEEGKRAVMLALITEYRIHVLPFDNETIELANRYVKEGIIPERFAADAQHIASACVHELDYILSLNFQHINKVKTKAATALVNQLSGYRSAVICTPMEVTDNEDDR